MWKCIKQSQVSIAIFLATLILFTSGLSSQEVVSFDSRFYVFALEMWRHGLSWFPTTYSQPYPDYTALSTFLIYCVSIVFGGVSKLSAVLPSAIAASITAVLTYHIGALYSRRYAWHAVILLLFTFTFIKSARAIALDMYPTVITVACFYLLHSSRILHVTKRVYWIYPLLFLGFCFRGPIGLVIPTGVICFYYLLDKDFFHFIVTGIGALCLLLLSTCGLLFLAYHVGGTLFMQDVFRMQVAGRIDNAFLPFHFYFTNSLLSYALSYPLAIFVVIGLFVYRKQLRDVSFLLKLTAWVLVILIGMSIPGDKKVRYILPMAPALALLAAYPLSFVSKERYFVWLRNTMTIFFLILPSIFLAITYHVVQVVTLNELSVTIPWMLLTAIYLVMQIISIIVFFKCNDNLRPSIVLVCAWICFIAAYFHLIEPIELAIDSAHDFVLQIESERHAAGAQLVFYRELPDSMPIKYIANMPEEEKPVFLRTTDELMVWRAPAFFVTSKSYFDDLSKRQAALFDVIKVGKMGHVELVVFRREK